MAQWGTKLDYMGYQVTGKTLGMIGLGNIGRDFLHLISPFEMNVLAYDPYITAERAAESGARKVELDELLAESDYVVILCNLTPETFHLMNAERFAQMKPTAILVNVARGPIVEETALYDALANGQIRVRRHGRLRSRSRPIRTIRSSRWATSSWRRMRWDGPRNRRWGSGRA